jgi:predicted nucleic acid-binding protein
MIFVDTGFIFALFSAKDPDHVRVREVYDELEPQRLRDELVTTNHVVFETIQLTRGRIGVAEAKSLAELLYSERMARIHWATPEEEKAAVAYMAKFRDQKYSLVDCLSFVVMEELKISEALTVDSDFTHRFTARPGPSQT